MRLISLAIRATALTVLAAGALRAQDNSRTIDADEREGRRAVLGLTTSSGGERDTLGLMITGITVDGPAERAQLEEGNRIAAINGSNLRLAPADAGESDMRGLATRRLTRELAKVRPGDQVELRVWRNGRYETVRARTAAAESLPGQRVAVVRGLSLNARTRDREARARERDARPVLGVDLQPVGNRRDTLGVLVTRVVDGSPAERAGIVEGDRVAAVNGVDLRVSRDDAGDGWVSNAKSSRFTREMQRARVGEPVELRVYSNGQYRTVRVAPARAGEVYKEGRTNTFFFRNAVLDGDVMMPLPPVAPVPPVAPIAPVAPLIDLRVDTEAINERVNEAMRRAGEVMERSGAALRSMNVAGRRGIYRI